MRTHGKTDNRCLKMWSSLPLSGTRHNLEKLHHYLTPPLVAILLLLSTTMWVWWLRGFLLRPHSLAVPVILLGDSYPLRRHQFPPRTPRTWTSPWKAWALRAQSYLHGQVLLFPGGVRQSDKVKYNVNTQQKRYQITGFSYTSAWIAWRANAAPPWTYQRSITNAVLSLVALLADYSVVDSEAEYLDNLLDKIWTTSRFILNTIRSRCLRVIEISSS